LGHAPTLFRARRTKSIAAVNGPARSYVEGLMTSITWAGDAGGVVAESDFDEMFPDLFRAAYRVAYRLLGSREDAADCAQEACARACLRWEKLARGGSPLPWVVRVSGNLAIDRWRRQKTAAAAPADRDESQTEPGPDRVDLQRALEGLSKRQREVVVLRYLADVSEAQTGALLGCSIGSVKTHASRGLAALRAVLTLDDEEVS
jgi:RNA polymerase sigma-70 factor (sigma-E family)